MREMEMWVEGVSAPKCIPRITPAGPAVDMPILDCVYDILYRNAAPRRAVEAITGSFT